MSESEPWSAQNLGKLQVEVYDMSESEPWSAQNLGKLQVEVYDMSESEPWSAQNQQTPNRGLRHVGM